MALTIKMRIDEQPEHSYVFSTDGSEVVLIPLSVIQNGSYPAPEGYAYNLVSVNVPSTILDELNITANGTYTAEDGHAYDVVTVNVEPLLEEVTRSYSANGTYTIQPSEGYDGIEDAVITVAVPSPQTQTKSVNYNQNGNYSVAPDSGKLLDGVNVGVNVPNSYSSSDEGKVVQNGALVGQTSQNITQNGTYDTTVKNEVVVNVSGSAPVLIEKNISANGTYNASSDNAEGYSKVVANVPNTYSASDEGKVVDNGALVAQTSQNITANGTYDTTLNDEVVVNVSGGTADAYIRHGTFTTDSAPAMNAKAQTITLDPVVPSGNNITYVMVKKKNATLPNSGNGVIQAELTKQDMLSNPDYSSSNLNNKLYETVLYTSSATATSYATAFTATKNYGAYYIDGYSYNYGDVIGIKSRTSFVVAIRPAGGRGLEPNTEYEYICIITPAVS